MQAVHFVVTDEVRQDLGRVPCRIRMPGIDVELAHKAMSLQRDAGTGRAVRDERPREPVVRPRRDRVGRGVVAAVTIEDVVGILGRKQIGRPAPDRVGNDVGVDFETASVRLDDQVLERVEPGLDRGPVGGRLERVQIPRVSPPAHLRENRVRVGRQGPVHDCYDIGMVVQRRVERIHPEPAHLDARLCAGDRRGSGEHSKDTRRCHKQRSPLCHVDHGSPRRRASLTVRFLRPAGERVYYLGEVEGVNPQTRGSGGDGGNETTRTNSNTEKRRNGDQQNLIFSPFLRCSVPPCFD